MVLLENYFVEIQEIAKKSPMNHKCGALLIYQNKIIAFGFNKYTRNYLTSSLENHKDMKHSIHAEEMCIINALKKYSIDIIKNSTLIVFKFTKSGNLINSVPCKSCTDIICKYKIKRIFYST